MNNLTPYEVQQSPQTERDARDLAIIEALQRGEPYRKICAEHRISLGSLSVLAQRLASMEREGVAKLMALKSLDALEHWQQAMISGAKQGKHAPARDWLIHAKALEPLTSDTQAGAKVAVIIGMPGSPVELPSVQVLDGEGHSE